MKETLTAAPTAAPQTAAPAAAPQTAKAGEVQPTKDGQAPVGQQQPPQPFGGNFFISLLLMLALFYFMLIRPQQRKEKERRKMIEELRAGAKILFANGLMGTIAEAREKTFLVEIAPDVKIEVARDCVQGVVSAAANK